MSRLSLLPVTAVLVFASCTPEISISRVRPATYNLGTTRNLALVNFSGPERSTSLVQAELIQQILNEKFFRLYTDQVSSLPFTVSGAGVDFREMELLRARIPAEAYITIMVTDWRYDEMEQKKEKINKDGKKEIHTFRTPHARVAVFFKVILASTGRLIAAKEYKQEKDGTEFEVPAERPPSRSDLLRSACSSVVEAFLRDITPRRVVEGIHLDDEDKRLKPGIELCRQGHVEEALASFQGVLAADPSSSGAVYNCAVIYESLGDIEKAREGYARAYRMNPKPMYRQAADELERRLMEDAALSSKPVG